MSLKGCVCCQKKGLPVPDNKREAYLEDRYMRQHGSEGTSITISARDVVVSLAHLYNLHLMYIRLWNNGFACTRC